MVINQIPDFEDIQLVAIGFLANWIYIETLQGVFFCSMRYIKRERAACKVLLKEWSL